MRRKMDRLGLILIVVMLLLQPVEKKHSVVNERVIFLDDNR